jgi:hypothetical protein
MLVAAALTNKMARIVWALLIKGGVYQTSIVAAEGRMEGMAQ